MLGDQRRARARQRLGERAALAAGLDLRGKLGQRALALPALAARRASRRPGRPGAGSRGGRLHPALEHAAPRRRRRSSAPRRARPRRACRRGPPRRSRRRRSARPASARCRPCRTSTSRSTCAFCSGVPAPTAPSAERSRSDLVGRHVVARETAVSQLHHPGRPGDRELVQAIGARHYQGTSPPQALPARPPSSRASTGSETPITWRSAPAGFVSGPEEVEDRADGQLLAHRHDVLERGVVERGEHEAEADLADAGFDNVRRPRRSGPQGPPGRRRSRTGWWRSGFRAWRLGTRRPRR